MYKNEIETKIKAYVKQLQHMYIHLYIYEKKLCYCWFPSLDKHSNMPNFIFS